MGGREMEIVHLDFWDFLVCEKWKKKKPANSTNPNRLKKKTANSMADFQIFYKIAHKYRETCLGMVFCYVLQ